MASARFTRNLTALYGVQIATLVLPLVTLPFLTRVLQPGAWGQLASVQALGLTLSLLVEYGFGFSATRTVAANQGNAAVHARTAAQVLSAKIALACLTVLVGLVIFVFVPGFREQPLLFACGLLYAIAQGLTPLWYFQGIEDLRTAAANDVAMKVLSTALIFLLVRTPSDAWLVLAAQAGTVALGQAINTVRLYRRVPYVAPSFAAARAGLTSGWSMFLFRGAVGLYTSANAALLRAFVPGAAVANYANADRLANAAKGMMQPVTQALFPRLSHLVHCEPQAATRLVRRSLLVLVGLSSLVAVIAVLVAPTFIPWFLGREYQDSVPLFQLLCLTLPVIAASNVLGVQWMLPQGMDRAFNTIVMTTGLLNVSLVILLIPHFQLRGMVYAVMLSETFVTATMVLYLSFRRASPLGKAGRVV